MWLDNKRTALYRLYGEGDVLLYIGITHDIEERFKRHSELKDWWPQVTRHTEEWFADRPTAAAAELAAIKSEGALHNSMGTPWAPRQRQLEPDERTVKQLRSNLGEQCQRVFYSGEAVAVVDGTLKRKRIAVVVSPDFYARALAALGDDD